MIGGDGSGGSGEGRGHNNGGGGGGGGRQGGRRNRGNSKGQNRFEKGPDSSVDTSSGSEKEARTNQATVDPPAIVNQGSPSHFYQTKTATPAVKRGGGGGDSAAHIQSIKRSYARFDTNVLIAVPGIPFSSDHNVPDLVHFTQALCSAVEGVRVACDDTLEEWTRGWEKV